ncbi:Uncharacterised protein [uncultured archaeon]|nr:Uncharacterised protein [uncultured archaeon]
MDARFRALFILAVVNAVLVPQYVSSQQDYAGPYETSTSIDYSQFLGHFVSSSSTSTTSSTTYPWADIPGLMRTPDYVVESHLDEVRRSGSNITIINPDNPAFYLENETLLTENQRIYRLKSMQGLSLGCGAFSGICTVHFDSTGDGKLDCCNATTYEPCKDCFDYCVGECQKKGDVVRSCFGNQDEGVACDCVNATATCYGFTPEGSATTSTTIAETIPDMKSGNSFLVVYLIVLMLLIAAAIFFVRNIGPKD